MNELPSAEFRKQYPRLTEETLVTVNGHPIGMWKPLPPDALVSPTFRFQTIPDDLPPGRTEVPADGLMGIGSGEGVRMTRTTQAQRDELLRKINQR